MIHRKADERIIQWIRGGEKALLVSGARQVGKTYSIRRCLSDEACDHLEINLIEHPELLPAFEQSRTIDDLVLSLSAATNYHFTKERSVLFIDEVQECTDIVTKIKFWVDDGRYRFILSGSLPGVELTDLRSVPVGYLEEINMFPLDFEEFLIASGVTDETIRHLQSAFLQETPIPSIVHDKMMEHFRRYLVVGGMPEAVKEYLSSGDIGYVSEIQRNILSAYKRDFTKYEQKEKKLMLISVYDQIPSNLLRQNRRFQYADIRKGLKFERIENSFLWLTAAGVAIPVYNATEPRVSLNQNKKSSLFKLYSSDVGLLTMQYDDAMRFGILTNQEKLNLGGIFENAAAQQLNTHGFQGYFYNSHRNGKLDFLIESGGHVIPIEVKSGKDYYFHSALTKVTENPEYQIEKAYVFGDCNISVNGKIRYMPIYLCSFLTKRMKMPVLSPME